ncbi:MAG TPA: CRTAC1 family protein, partial [Myxococcota bacterium]|nr:CRTAC1 family protein [Myxococcota bacterium]
SWGRGASMGRYNVVFGLALGVLAGCPPSDADTSPDKPPRETDVPDTDGPGPSDTDRPESPPEESDPPPVDSQPPEPDVPPPPSSLGAGFVDVSSAVWARGQEQADTPDVAAHDPADMHWVVVGDIGDDGVMDVYAANVLRPATDVAPSRGQVYTYEAGALTWSRERTADAQWSFGPLLAIIDLDGDGDTDLLRSSTDNTIQLATPRGWRGVSMGTPPGRDRVTGLNAFTLADVDLDGWLDVVFMPDECSRSPRYGTQLLLRTGEAAWSLRVDLTAQVPEGNAYAALQAPLGGDAPYLLLVGEGCDELNGPSVFLGINGRDASGYPTYAWTDPTPMDALYRYDPTAPFMPLSRRQPMGAMVTDLDLDGVLDVAFSLSDTWLHIFSAGPMLVDHTIAYDLRHRLGNRGTEQLPWGVAPVDVDRDGRPDLIVAHGDDGSSSWETPWNGPYQPAVHWNDGQRGFADVTALAGLMVDGNWRGVTVADLDGDADPDLGIGGNGWLPLVARNDVETGAHGLALRLRGTTSNHLGVGAVVRLEADGLPAQTRLMGEIGSPDGGSAPELFFGLGAAAEASRVTVTWPSGVVQEVSGLAGGATHTLVEPALITLSEPDRHLPADGVSVLEVSVTPRAPDGSPRAAAVTIEAPWGAATWEGPAQVVGDRVVRRLIAPTVAQTSVVEVTVDGVAAPIRPRVWWD